MARLNRLQHLLTAMLLAAAMVFIMPNDSNAQDTVTTSSGLRYIDNAPGAGEKAKAGDNVVVHYTGWLYVDGEKGSKFDSSVDRNQPFNFPLGASRVISGWDEGVAGMRPGGKRTLIIPPALGYGARGAGGVIPPNATLMFDVELIEIR
ncbi:MAG: FKBP-type peptidyl-prolyl cis-trans isomerase [Alphaproteobacteria bacterium]